MHDPRHAIASLVLLAVVACASSSDAGESTTIADDTSGTTHAAGTTTTSGGPAAGTTASPGTASDGEGPGDTSTSGDSPAACTNPVFETSQPDDGWSTENYYVHNNMWNSDCCQTLYACAYDDWYVVSNQTNDQGAVKTYPNVHRDYPSKPIDTFTVLTSTFAATSPHVGIYNVSYDLWIDGIAAPGGAELMIWTENFDQVPGGDVVASVELSGIDWQVWKADWDWTYIALVPDAPVTEGTLDLLEMLEWLAAQGWIRSDSTIEQIGFGVEIVSTEGNDEMFVFTDFSIDDGS